MITALNQILLLTYFGFSHLSLDGVCWRPAPANDVSC